MGGALTGEPAAGLCAACAHARRLASRRGSAFWLCRRAERDPAFARYPRLPVARCAGYERGEPGGSPAGADGGEGERPAVAAEERTMTRATPSAGSGLPPYRVTARMPAEPVENKIHEDDIARRYGFRGGLVPGVVVYAWLTRPVVEALGPEWLERGAFAARFLKPIYYGEPATIDAVVTERSPARVVVEARALDRAGETCGQATFTLDAEAAVAPPAGAYASAALPAERPTASREVLAARAVLGTPSVRVDRAAARQFLDKVGDAWPLYDGEGARVHPGFYLDQANKALSLNVRVSPWVHVESEGRHLGPARVGERLDTRARVARLFERKGHEFVELDCLLVADGERPVAQVRHVAIYRLREARDT